MNLDEYVPVDDPNRGPVHKDDDKAPGKIRALSVYGLLMMLSFLGFAAYCVMRLCLPLVVWATTLCALAGVVLAVIFYASSSAGLWPVAGWLGFTVGSVAFRTIYESILIRIAPGDRVLIF